jgi:RNA polymerase sigma factor (sigma-70 family)
MESDGEAMTGAGLRISDGSGAPGDDTLDRLAARYRAPLMRYFLRRGVSHETAEDCVQDVFLRIAQAEPGLIENAEAYLFKIAANVLVDRARRAKTRSESLHDPLGDQPLASREGSPARVFEDRQALRRLAAVLDELPSRTREIFLLNRLDGLSYTQLAVRYAVNVKVIEREMSRVLVHLRQRFPHDDRP